MSVEIRIYRMSQNSAVTVMTIRGLEQGSFSISDEGLRTFYLVCLGDGRVEAQRSEGRRLWRDREL